MPRAQPALASRRFGRRVTSSCIPPVPPGSQGREGDGHPRGTLTEGGGLLGKETTAMTQRLNHRPQGDSEGTPRAPWPVHTAPALRSPSSGSLWLINQRSLELIPPRFLQAPSRRVLLNISTILGHPDTPWMSHGTPASHGTRISPGTPPCSTPWHPDIHWHPNIPCHPDIPWPRRSHDSSRAGILAGSLENSGPGRALPIRSLQIGIYSRIWGFM